MKLWMKPIALFLATAGLLGGIAMLSGIIPIGASGGHWPITAKILHFSMERSISTYSMRIETPDLSNLSMIQRGAGHYEIGCRYCHGVPGSAQNFLGQQMTAKAPYLPPSISKWESKELFRIVKHGVKFTGMPHWPALDRDDEVWSMVAFLRTLPELKRTEYQQLVFENKNPEPSPFSSFHERMILQRCANCHGHDGNGRGEGSFPKLAGQKKEYLEGSLRAYAQGKRHSGTMELVASALEEEMIKELSRFYHDQKRKMARPSQHLVKDFQQALERGATIALKGIPEQRVATCFECHGPKHTTNLHSEHIPLLSGQPAEYLIGQLKLIMEKKRGGTEYLKLMHKSVPKLTPEQIRDVALYYESLAPSHE